MKKLYSDRLSELESQLSEKTKRVEKLETDKQVRSLLPTILLPNLGRYESL